MAAKCGDEGLDGRGEVMRQALPPQQFGKTVDGHGPSACRKQDLEKLLRPASPEVTGSERAARVLDRDGPKEPNRARRGTTRGAHVSCRVRCGRNRLLVGIPGGSHRSDGSGMRRIP